MAKKKAVPAPKSVRQPRVGEIVHYNLPFGRRRGQHRPAIVTEVDRIAEHETAPVKVNLTVFRGRADDFPDPDAAPDAAPDYSPRYVGWVIYATDGTPSSWHWPPQE